MKPSLMPGRCNRCEINLRRTGHGWCNPCNNKYNRDKRAGLTTPRKVGRETHREYNLRKIGWNTELFDFVLAEQGGVCRICKQLKPKMVADHCHRTGNPRSVLCRGCNLLIGHAYENPQTLISAAQYVALQG